MFTPTGFMSDERLFVLLITQQLRTECQISQRPRGAWRLRLITADVGPRAAGLGSVHIHDRAGPGSLGEGGVHRAHGY